MDRLDGGITFSTSPSVRSFVRPSVRYQTCEHDILKTNEPSRCKLAQVVGDSVMKRSTLGVEGQRSSSYKAEDIFSGLSEAL